MYAKIALPIPGKCVFDYLVPQELQAKLQPGMRVRVPFGRRMATGFCTGTSQNSDVPLEKLREIHSLLDESPVVDSVMLKFTKWWAQYYYCSEGEALSATVPSEIGRHGTNRETVVELDRSRDLEEDVADSKCPAQSRILRFLKECDRPLSRQEVLRKLRVSASALDALCRKGAVRLTTREKDIDPFAGLPCPPLALPVLTSEQEAVLRDITAALDRKNFQPFLLFGITGSGKTEIYIRAIEHCVALGKQAIVLVPEIALTPQTVIRFKQRFPNVAVLHSGLSPAQRAHQWQQIEHGKVPVIIGARSALFAPTRNLGIIVVDEEHEPSFKQQNSPRYHARDLAVKRAQVYGAVVVLGSATPSMESYYNAITGKYRLERIVSRIGNARLPEFITIDMREECRDQKRFAYLSRYLLRKIERCLQDKEQVILFLNRRGFATSILCPMCGFQAVCKHCAVSLTYHQKTQRALCHYCGYDVLPPEKCPVCGLDGIRFTGAGTQRIEKSLRAIFPGARIMRMDSDSMTTRHRYEEAFLAVSRQEVDILLGTQMVAKGLDFPNVTLVGIISADSVLQIPDLRAAERTFQLMVQVGGRAGRGQKPGQVVLQTFHPDHYAIAYARTQDYEAFARQELAVRKELQYPPTGKLLRVIVEGKDEGKVIEHSRKLALAVAGIERAEILGPAPAPVAKVNDRHRWHIIIKSGALEVIAQCAGAILPLSNGNGRIKVHIDRDPISTT